jgi:outer membrane protein
MAAMTPTMRCAVLACLAPICGVMLAGCNDTSDLAPPSASTPWQISPQAHADFGHGSSWGRAADKIGEQHFDVASNAALPWPQSSDTIDLSHVYPLLDLIDLAQRRNRTTRIAWEQARQAAIDVGISRAAYLPTLTASAMGGFERIASPFPPNFVPRGYITADAQEVLPELAIRYLLLDFGSRKAATEVAKQQSFAANVSFTAAHQALILNVAKAYFTLDGVNAQLKAAHQAFDNATMLQRSAEAMYAHGLGTIVNVQLARRGAAQAVFDIAAATGAQHEAMDTLLAVLELPPTTKLLVADNSTQPLPRGTGETVDALLQDALQYRPDLLADLARLRASDAGIAEARSEFYPKLSISANVQGNVGEISVDGGRYQSVTQPQAGLFLRFDWPLYQGGLLRNRLRVAQSKRAEAEDALEEGNDQALRQVALAYDEVETGLSQYDAAMALHTASQAAFDASSQAYAHGVGTLTDAVNAQTALASAQATVVRTHAQSLVNAAALAFATGTLTSGLAPGLSGGTP